MDRAKRRYVKHIRVSSLTIEGVLSVRCGVAVSSADRLLRTCFFFKFIVMLHCKSMGILKRPMILFSAI